MSSIGLRLSNSYSEVSPAHSPIGPLTDNRNLADILGGEATASSIALLTRVKIWGTDPTPSASIRQGIRSYI